ncbi:MAG: S1 RNA-binding domain-containing protein [Treponema sp.]|nr:S1 RNA-binding domain-containing protein [Treponema sp.]
MNNRMEIGDQFETEIVQIQKDYVFLAMDAKSEGICDTADFLDKEGKLTVKEGDKVKVFFTGYINGEMRFTAKIAGEKADKSMIENAYNAKIPVDGHVEKEIKGGYEVKIGSSRAFCPYSQMGFRQKEEPSYYVGRTMPFIIMEYKNDGKDLTVSNRVLGEQQYAEKLDSLAREITPGKIVEGVVESVQSFGAFVNVNGFRTLLPVSEIQYDRVEDINSVIAVGQTVKAQVIKADWKNERVSISVKAILEDPWKASAESLKLETKYDGKVARVTDFGVFVNLVKGVDGLVHISELEGVNKNTNIKKLYKPGDEMSVVIKEMDIQNKRIALVPASSVEQDLSAAKYLSSQKDDDDDSYNPFAALLK